MATGYCEPDDVRKALKEDDLSGSINESMVLPGIEAVSEWFRKRAKTHVYDSSGADSDVVPTSAASAATISLDVPSSPHAQDRQLFRSNEAARYPVTHAGPYARIRLPHTHVQTVTSLEVRERDGGREDWTAEKTEGVGEDYYVEADGSSEYGRTYLYVRASSIGARTDYGNLLTVGYEYGIDAQDEDWQDVRRGIANLAALEVLEDDGVIAQIPDNARLANVQTEYDNLHSRAQTYLGGYLSVGVA